MVQDMLDRGIIEPSRSPWASPVVLVEKKDGTLHFCVDYRRLNAATKIEVFPLPRIDDSLDMLSKSKYFSTLDLDSGFWQVPIEPSSQEKTAFITHSGLYQFQVMPFGLVNAPSTFQRLMKSVLAGLSGETCIVYIDDIVPGATFQEHLNNLREVLDRLRSARLKLKPKKYNLAEQQVEYLGYVVSQDGLTADPKKVEAVQKFPVPADLKDLRSFLGLASYYRRFIPHFSAIAGPLFSLTRKDVKFEWSLDCQRALDQLKQLLTTAPVMTLPDFEREFLLETDASGLGLGAVLAQKQDEGLVRPIAFASRTLLPHEKNYGSTELQALAVVWAVKHYRHYLYGHRCQVYTDHEALKSLLNAPHPSGKLARWGLALQEVDIVINYRHGKGNSNADALSGNPAATAPWDGQSPPFAILAAIQTMASSEDGDLVPGVRTVDPTLQESQRADPELKLIFDYLEEGVLPTEEKQTKEFVLGKSQFVITDGVLYHSEKNKSLRIIPLVGARKKLFKEVHEGVYGAHVRDAKIHGELSKYYWWPNMRKDVVDWCRACLTCATRQTSKKTKPPLVPIPVGGPWDRVGVDIVQLPKSHSGNQYAVVFCNYLTKWPEVFPTKDQTALTVARLLVREIIPRHGVPRQLLSDRGSAFLSKLMMEIYKLLGVKKVNTTAYHPQYDGLVERFNRSLIDMLSKTVQAHGQDWDEKLPFVLFAYRASIQQSTLESPFYLMYGRDPSCLLMQS